MDLLYEDLGPTVRWEAENHLRQCPECAREYNELKQTLGAVRGLLDPEPPLGLKTRVKTQVREAVPRKKSLWTKMPRGVLAAAAMIVLGITVGLIAAHEYPRFTGKSTSSETAAIEKEKSKELALLTPPAPAPAKDEKALAETGREQGTTVAQPSGLASVNQPTPASGLTPAPPPTETPAEKPAEAPPMEVAKLEAEAPSAAPEASAEPKKTDELAKSEAQPPAPEPPAITPEPGARAITPAISPPPPAPEPPKPKPEPEYKENSGWFDDQGKAGAANAAKEKKAEPSAAGKGAGPEGYVREEAPAPPSAGETKSAKAEAVEHDKDMGTAGEARKMSDQEKAAPKSEAKRDESVRGGASDKSRTAPPWEGPSAPTSKPPLSAPASKPQPPPAPALTPAPPVESKPSSTIEQALELEAEGRYRQALDIYEGSLRGMGYSEGSARAKRPEKSEPGAPSDGITVTKPRCGSDVSKAVNGAARCYRRLLQFGKARDVEDWYKNKCQK